ncbi:hypothetical protein PRZ48_008076 [Zasmidium cellare]|uniref:Uncharacterized protein n=1 Tax=Zasmidium cellare TaxID=395010 RepID=A0ABR0EFI6_ZASCE|nr:hypothetical protein PRZ48_008076 [Zasmidium cellare]
MPLVPFTNEDTLMRDGQWQLYRHEFALSVDLDDLPPIGHDIEPTAAEKRLAGNFKTDAERGYDPQALTAADFSSRNVHQRATRKWKAIRKDGEVADKAKFDKNNAVAWGNTRKSD